MRVFAFCAIFALCVAVAIAGVHTGNGQQQKRAGNGKIEHVVVLMLENRAFDHMCGWLNQWRKPGDKKVDGLTGKEFNIAGKNRTKFYVRDQCPYVHPFDPIHSVDGTTAEISGIMDDPKAWIDPSPMSGFAELHERHHDPEFWTVMHGFNPNLVPSISTLATEFAVFDKWYASLPGPTFPNRLFFHSGTAHGMTSNTILDYIPGMPQKSTFDVLNDKNISWGAYYQDVSDLLLFRSMRELKNLERIHDFKAFQDDAASGDLPSYSWISPQFFPFFDEPASDQHPDHDVVDGERVIAKVYDALRNGPKWNNTLFVVTYDEHGGLYDHVSPPMTHVPNPDGINGPEGFNYTRLGLRVCTVMASPLIPKGTVVSEPPEAPHKRFVHESMYSTLRDLFGLEETLTNRTDFAASFESVISLDEPRSDCPKSIPVPTDDPKRQESVAAEQRERPPNGLQQFFYGMLEDALADVRGVPAEERKRGKHISDQQPGSATAHKTQDSMGRAARKMVDEIKSHVRR